MGNYLNASDLGRDKAEGLVQFHGAVPMTNPPADLGRVPENAVLVCVLRNPMFDAALLVNSEREYNAATSPSDPRPKKWLLMTKAEARKMADRPEDV